MRKMDKMNGQPCDCLNCGGHGLVLSMAGEPTECPQCDGGTWWRYDSGVMAQWYGGPLTGYRDTPEATP
jgi:hypothetical protein